MVNKHWLDWCTPRHQTHTVAHRTQSKHVRFSRPPEGYSAFGPIEQSRHLGRWLHEGQATNIHFVMDRSSPVYMKGARACDWELHLIRAFYKSHHLPLKLSRNAEVAQLDLAFAATRGSAGEKEEKSFA